MIRPSLRPRLCRLRAAGFTLIELMVTMAIVAMLTAIAYPSYRNYVIRGQLTTGTDALSAMQANMERYFQDNRTYLPANNFPTPCQPSTLVGPTSAPFTVGCPNTLTATTYVLQAAGSGSVAGFTFYVDQQGNQSTIIGAGAPSGWTSCATGWETKPGQC